MLEQGVLSGQAASRGRLLCGLCAQAGKQRKDLTSPVGRSFAIPVRGELPYVPFLKKENS
jgi:hypothetical protein